MMKHTNSIFHDSGDGVYIRIPPSDKAALGTIRSMRSYGYAAGANELVRIFPQLVLLRPVDEISFYEAIHDSLRNCFMTGQYTGLNRIFTDETFIDEKLKLIDMILNANYVCAITVYENDSYGAKKIICGAMYEGALPCISALYFCDINQQSSMYGCNNPQHFINRGEDV